MPDSNQQLPPLPPQIPEDEKQSDSPSTLEQESRPSRKRGFKPGQFLLLSWLFLAVGIVGLVSNPLYEYPDQPYVGEEADEIPSYISIHPVQISKPTDNTVMLTFHLTKDDPSSFVSLFADIEVGTKEKYSSLYDFTNIRMGYAQEEVWTSVLCTSPQFEGYDASDIEANIEYDHSTSFNLSYYDYYLEDGDQNNYENLMKRYLEHFPEQNPTIDIISDGVDQQTGIVQYKMSIDSNNSIFGNVNIIFRNQGEVVFATIDSVESSTNQHTFVYSAPIPLPEYDSVEIQYITE